MDHQSICFNKIAPSVHSHFSSILCILSLNMFNIVRHLFLFSSQCSIVTDNLDSRVNWYRQDNFHDCSAELLQKIRPIKRDREAECKITALLLFVKFTNIG